VLSVDGIQIIEHSDKHYFSVDTNRNPFRKLQTNLVTITPRSEPDKLMDSTLICGTQGWQHASWNTDYFPEECPQDWYFAYYSNDFRGVWIPACFWDQPDIDLFLEDGDENFYYVFELPRNWITRVDSIIAILAPITAQIACLVVTPADGVDQSKWVPDAIRLSSTYPLALDIPTDNAPGAQLAKQHGWSIVWQAEAGGPATPGQFLPVVTQQDDLRQLRQLIEVTAEWAGTTRQAGIFVKPIRQAPEIAGKIRELAELLGV